MFHGDAGPADPLHPGPHHDLVLQVDLRAEIDRKAGENQGSDLLVRLFTECDPSHFGILREAGIVDVANRICVAKTDLYFGFVNFAQKLSLGDLDLTIDCCGIVSRFTPCEQLMHYLLIYEVVDDYAERRTQFRGVHLKLAWEAVERGEMILGGALANPADKAILLFKGESPEVAEKFARQDPYVVNGLVKKWEVREWTTVVGELAANPVRG